MSTEPTENENQRGTRAPALVRVEFGVVLDDRGSTDLVDDAKQAREQVTAHGGVAVRIETRPLDAPSARPGTRYEGLAVEEVVVSYDQARQNYSEALAGWSAAEERAAVATRALTDALHQVDAAIAAGHLDGGLDAPRRTLLDAVEAARAPAAFSVTAGTGTPLGAQGPPHAVPCCDSTSTTRAAAFVRHANPPVSRPTESRPSMAVDPSILTVTELTTGLRAGAAGTHATEAAVELLIRHWRWLTRPDFVRACVEHVDGAPDPVLSVDWQAARTHAESTAAPESERAVVLIAAQIGTLPGAEHGIPDTYPSLGWLIPSLGRMDVDLVLAAISHAGGTHDDVEHLEELGMTGERGVTPSSVRLIPGAVHPWPAPGLPGLAEQDEPGATQ